MAKKTSIFSNKKLIMFFLFMIIILPLFEPYLKIHEGLDPSLIPWWGWTIMGVGVVVAIIVALVTG